ncbi:MAG: PEP-CTERM system TPR-repeat protein PrsT [Rhodocyclaceae bacterium]|nr:PEP-CTERM system TPR-repeat protein PrsT [Rhodocyclaceae bacterium]
MKLINAHLAAVAAAAFLAVACSNSTSDSIRQGKELLNKGELSSAVISFKNAVQNDASSSEARIALADALERTGDMVGAEQHFRQALVHGGNADDLAPRIALLLLDRGDYAILVKDFADRELALPAADSELRGIVALAHLALRQKDKAEAQLAKARVNGPAVRLAKAQMAILSNRPQEAVAEVEGVVREGKAPWWVLRAASRLYAARGDQANALAAMKSSYELAGWHQGVIGEYAEQLFEAGKSAEAKPLLNKLRKIAPRYWRTAFVEALFQMEEGKQDQAHDLVTKVLVALPEHIPSLLIAAKVELDRGELSSADSRLRKILFINPASIGALRMQLMLELRRNDLQAAAAILERALRLAPNDRGLLAASAELAWAKGDKTSAVKILARAAQTQPPRADILTQLAEMKFALGKRDEADQAIGQAIQLSRDNTSLRPGVFRALLNMRMLDKARDMAKVEMELRPKEPEPYLWMAAVVGSDGDEEAALAQIGRALDIRPDYYPALMALAKTATTADRAKQYDDRLQKAVDAGTKDARIYFDLAKRMRIAGTDADKVGALLDRSVAADPESVGLREAAIRHWLVWGKQDKALALATGGEAAHADNVAMKALAASTHEAAGNFEQAAAKYAELKARFPERVDWGLKHAQTLVRAGKVSDAIQALRKLISLRPDEHTPYQMLAMLQVEQKQGDDALVTAGMLADRPKLKAAGLLLRGDVHAFVQDRAKALKAYDEAGKAGAMEAAVLRKIELQDRTGGEAFAAAELHDWLASHPDSIPALSLATRRASAKQDYATAARYLETIVKLNPNNPIVLNDLAWAYAQARNPAALTTAKKAIALAPENPQVLDTLAEAQALAGQKRDAIASLRLAKALAPDNPVVKVHLAELLVEEGGKKEAAGLLEGIDQRALDKEATIRFQRVKGRL